MLTRATAKNSNISETPRKTPRHNTLQLYVAQHTLRFDAVRIEYLVRRGGGASLINWVISPVERMRTWDEIGTANKRSGGNEANTSEAGIGQRPRPPHEVVQKPGGSSVAPPADGRRCPLAPLKDGEAPYGAGAASRRSNNTSLRPYVVPYTNRSTSPGVKPGAPPAVKQLGPDDNGVTLRYEYGKRASGKDDHAIISSDRPAESRGFAALRP